MNRECTYRNLAVTLRSNLGVILVSLASSTGFALRLTLMRCRLPRTLRPGCACSLSDTKPRGSFPGRVETGYYCVADRHVVLCDEKGRPIGEKRFLDEGADARGIACWML